MTVAMSSPAPAPAESAKPTTKGKQSAADKDDGAAGFEAILSSLGEDAQTSDTDGASTKVDATALVSVPVQPDGMVDASKDTAQDPNLLLANLLQPVSVNDTNVDLDAASDGANVVNGAAKATLSADKASFHNRGESGDQTKASLVDASKGALTGVDVPKETAPVETKASQDQKAHKMQGILGALEDARAKSKESQTDQSQGKSETVLLNQDLLKSAAVEAAKRPQEPMLTKAHAPDGNGAGAGALQGSSQPTVTYQPTGAVLGSMLPTDGLSGQQVNYWVSSEIQNAEMKLDGLGKGPVEISISVHGKEADITFRTDEIQTRELLESSSSNLKDLMNREGMVLSGMTVGTNTFGGSNQNGKSGGKNNQGVRPMIGVVVPAVRVQAGVKAAGSIGKSLDLFV